MPPTSVYPLKPQHFQTCGVRIPLGVKSLPEAIKVIHPLPESYAHFEKLRQGGRDHDFTVILGDTKIRCHKDLLHGRIPFFRALFDVNMNESTRGEIDLSASIEDDAVVRAVLDYAYSGMITISESNAPQLMMASNFFCMKEILDECALFMRRRLNNTNVIPLLHFYRLLASKETDTALRFIDANFVPISHTPEYLNLHSDELFTIINRNSLNIDNEAQVFDAVSRWLNENTERLKYAANLLKSIRLPLLSSSFMSETVETTEWVMNDPACILLVKKYSRNGPIRGEIMFKTDARFCEDAPRIIACFESCHEWDETDKKTHMHLFNPTNYSWTSTHSKERAESITNTLIVMDNKVYFFDGSVYDTQENRWNQDGPDRDRGSSMAVGAIGGKIYLAGGAYDLGHFTMSRVIVCDDPVGVPRAWKELSSMSRARGCSASCVLDDKFYVFGGPEVNDDWDLEDIGLDCEVFDPLTNRWTPIAPMIARRFNCKAAAFKGKIYLSGGNDGSESSFDVECYDPETDKWTILNPMTTAKWRFQRLVALLVSNGRLLAVEIDGDRYDGTFYTIYIYHEETDRWSKLTKQRASLWIETCEHFTFALPVPATYGSPNAYLEQPSVENNGFLHYQLSVGLLDAIIEARFDHPTEAQHELLSMPTLEQNLICQAKAGAGKSSGVVIAALHQLDQTTDGPAVLVLSRTREDANNMKKEFCRFSKNFPEEDVVICNVNGRIKKVTNCIKDTYTKIMIGTIGKVLSLISTGILTTDSLQMVVIDDCDQIINDHNCERNLKSILAAVPQKTRFLLTSSNLSADFRKKCENILPKSCTPVN